MCVAGCLRFVVCCVPVAVCCLLLFDVWCLSVVVGCCLLSAVCWFVFADCCVLLIGCWLLKLVFGVRRALFVVRCLSLVVCCVACAPLFGGVVWCVLRFECCSLFVVRCLLLVMFCWSCVVCCLLFGVCRL